MRHRIRLLPALTAALTLLSAAAPVRAAEPPLDERQIHVGNWESACTIDGELHALRMGRDQDHDLTFALRAFCETLGYTVSWDGEQGAITLTRGGDEIRVLVGQRHCLVNGSRFFLQKPVQIDEFGTAYLPLCFAETALGLTLTDAQYAPEPSMRIYDVFLETATTNYDELQRLSRAGEEAWRTDPVEVAVRFARQLGFSGAASSAEVPGDAEQARAHFRSGDGRVMVIDLIKPAAKGADGIWAVSHWYDENSKLYHARDLSKLQPLFHHHEDQLSDKSLGVLRGVVADTFTRAYSPYYDVLGFEAAGLRCTVTEGKLLAEFNLTLVTRNFPKKAGDIGWIRAVKEQGGNYLALYEDFLLALQINFSMRVEGTLDADGNLAPDSVVLSAYNGEQGYSPIEEFFPG